MPGAHRQGLANETMPADPRPRARYFVLHRDNAWFMIFTGEEFGPYKSEREAKLFAIDAAYKLAEHGEESEVVLAGEAGALSPIWLYGRDPYPPRE